MNKNILFLIFVSALAGLNLGTVRKAEDPIRDTQTNPILYEQKKEEEKDGKKGPLMYHVKNNPRETFFIDPPFEKEKKSFSGEIATEKISSPGDDASWWEEQPTVPQTGQPAETVPEPLPEPLAEAGKVQTGNDAEPPALTPGGEGAASEAEAPPDKSNDYWW